MRRLVLVALLLAVPASAHARPPAGVLVLDGHRVHRAPADGATSPDLPPPPASRRAPPRRASAAARHRHRRPRPTLDSELRRLRDTGAITPAQLAARRAELRRVHAALRSLSPARRYQLAAVLANAEGMARRGTLTASRLPALFLTLRRNRQWYTDGPLIAPGQRVRFAGSQLVWEHYAGEGIQLQVLGSFGAVNGRFQAHDATSLRSGLDELVPLAARRAGGLAWEYQFPYGGGLPPWTSSISQGTAIQALAHGSRLLDDPALLDTARRALGVFARSPRRGGVRVTGPGGGPHYLIYSFAPGVRVINAFLQSVTGLFDLVQAGGGPRAATLYSAGEREAERELPSYDTGAWSLYQPGEESPLSYHELVRDFLRDLCTRTGREVFCSTADRFTDYLHEPPVLELLTRTVTAGRTGLVRFRLTKISRLGMVINSADGATVLATSATVSRGVHGYAWRPPRHPGIYSVRLRATDLAGNVGRASGTLDVLPTR